MANEYISKDRLREIIGDVNEVCPYKVPGDYDTYSQYNEGWQDACNTIERMIEAEDGTELITCKDCAHLCYEDLGIYYCGNIGIRGQLSPDDYCSRANSKRDKK